MKPLTTTQLNKILSETSVTKKTFLGTFPACFSPKTKRGSYSFISNTDEHGEVGSHWCAWIARNNNLYFFDSFGRAPDDSTFPENFIDIAKKYKKVYYSNQRVQDWRSNACGYFCIHFICLLSLGLTYDEFLSEYSRNYMGNEIVAVDFVDSIT